MILLLRTDKPESELYLYTPDGELIDSLIWHAHRTLSDTLLTQIEDLLKANNVGKHSLTAIGVYQGPGSFTGLRIGIAVANALAYALHIPIAAAQGETWQKTNLATLVGQEAGKEGVVPHYGAEVHITQPRK